MPGKVNPTQAEAMLMVSIQVIGLDTAVAMAGQEGNFQLNAFRPIIINNVLQSIRLISDMCDHFREHMVEGAVLNEAQITTNIERSVMMVTALSPHIGYDEASRIAHLAIDEDLTLREAALRSELVDDELFDRVVIPEELTRPSPSEA
jgi:fumarate hydratase class II